MMKSLMALVPVIGLVLAFAPRAQAADGKQVFLDSKCATCHSVKSQKIDATKKEEGENKIVDLSDTGAKHDAAWMKKWLNKEVEKDGKKHKKKWQGSDADLDTLVNWLMTLKG